MPAGVDSKALLSENWIIKSAEAAEAAAAAAAAPASADGTPAPVPAFNPADPQYNELARRLSTSAAMRKVQELQEAVSLQEKQLVGLTGEAKETKKAELEESQQQLAEAQAALTELQASFEQDPLSLTPWMNALFALADSGCSSFDTGGTVTVCGPHPPPGVSLLDLLAPPVAAAGGPGGVSAWLYRGAERVLGTFKRRYELEKGPGHIKLTARLAVSPFGSTSATELAAAAEAALEATRQAVLGPEAAAAGGVLDAVLLHWLDYENMEAFMAVLLALKRLLAPAGYDPQAAAEAGQEPTPKLAALGLVCPTAAAVTAAVRAGVPISCVSLPFNLLDTSAADTGLLDLCRQHSIKVFTTSPTAHGLISESFIGTAAPDTAAGALPGCDNLAAGLDMVAWYGGWGRFQELLHTLKGVADKHGTSVQVVALAWLQQQGVVPLLPAHWGPGQAASSGAPWALSLGLAHHKMEPPPALTAAGDAVVAQEPEAAAVEAEGAEEAPAAAAAEAAAEGIEAVAEAAVPATTTAVASKGRRWVEGLGGLLEAEEVAALDRHAGRLSCAAA